MLKGSAQFAADTASRFGFGALRTIGLQFLWKPPRAKVCCVRRRMRRVWRVLMSSIVWTLEECCEVLRVELLFWM